MAGYDVHAAVKARLIDRRREVDELNRARAHRLVEQRGIDRLTDVIDKARDVCCRQGGWVVGAALAVLVGELRQAAAKDLIVGQTARRRDLEALGEQRDRCRRRRRHDQDVRTGQELVGRDDLSDCGRDGLLQPPIGDVGERLLKAGVGASQRPLEDETDVGAGVSDGAFGQVPPGGGQFAIAKVAAMGAPRLRLQVQRVVELKRDVLKAFGDQTCKR